MTQIHIVKHIDNSRLMKEVDYERSKECLFLMILGFFCLLIFLLLAWQHFKVVHYGYEGEALKKELSQLAEVNHQLRLERASLRSPQRVDLIAKTKLGLRAPLFDQIVILSEPFPTEPAGTLVAKSEKVPLNPAIVKQHVIH